MSIQIIKPSLLSTLQDLGRQGYGEFGIARSGAMDALSLKIANILLCNAWDEAALELCCIGGEYQFLDHHYFVLSGADFDAKLNQTPISTCKVYEAHAGDTLSLGQAKKGFRGYLSLAGGFDVTSFLGSKSSDIKSKIGLFDGRVMQAKDILPASASTFLFFRKECENPILQFEKEPKIRVILGPDDQAFTAKGIETFLNTTYNVAPNSSRMSISAVSDAKIEHKNGADIISDGIVFGSIQVPGNGLPIILMADRQTTGGYTRIATVISSDLPKLAQLSIKQNFSFQAVSIEEAYQAYQEENAMLKKLQNRIESIFES